MSGNKKVRLILLIFFVVFLNGGCSEKDKVQLQSNKLQSRPETELPSDVGKDSGSSEKTTLTGASADVVTSAGLAAVYVCGAVNQAGVYELPAGSRVNDAINAAGGMQPDAQIDQVNLAKSIEDGQMIRVPFYGETVDAGQAVGQTAAQETETRININTADAAKLKTIPGIGDSKAESIIRYREEKGSFGSVEDIMKIEGIKEGVFQKIKDYICVK